MLREGMYVTYYEYDASGDYIKRIGQWMCEKGDEAIIFAHEKSNKGEFLSHPIQKSSNEVKRADICSGATGIVSNMKIKIISKLERCDTDGYYFYFCKGINNNKSYVISEKQIRVANNAIDADLIELMAEGRFCNPIDFLYRYQIVKYVSDVINVPVEYESAIGKRIELLEHQLETVKSVAAKNPIRAILADEVGLGKTIEALTLLDYALKTGLCKKGLIIVPEQLRYQWIYEAKSKFNIEPIIFTYYSFQKGTQLSDVCVISEWDFCHYFEHFKWKQWDFIICDEVHRAVRNNKVYSSLLKICKMAPNVLLLSATPLLQRGKEMYRLLKLYDPDYYTQLTLEGFSKTLEARKEVIEKISKISYGFKRKHDLDHALKCIYLFQDLAEKNNDIQLQHLLNTINQDDESEAVDGVMQAFDYIDWRYEISAKYIRHRRNDILDPSSKRYLFAEVEFYFDSGEAEGENKIYQVLRDEIEECIKSGNISTDKVMMVGSALFSSFSALHDVLVKNDLNEVLTNTYHLNYKQQILERNTLTNSRIEALVDFLKGNKSIQKNKTIIFTDFGSSALLIKNRLEKEFGASKVALFTFALGSAELNKINNNLNGLEDCCFLVCDKSGAEGKNFQFADYIIHFDTPWIPTDLEQRIGRLDRIGRGPNRPVNNVVIYSRDTIEEDLILMCKNDLNIYNESLSGIEIVFDQITSLIKESIKENALLGFSLVGNEIKDLKKKCENAVQQEAYEQMSVQAGNDYINKVKDFIDKFTGPDYLSFVYSLCEYHSRKGYTVKKDKMDVFLEGYNGYYEDVSGTFSIEEALSDENKIFLSINTPLIRAICLDAKNDSHSRISAIRVSDSKFEWRGFISIWQLQLHLREYYQGEWEDSLEKISSAYIEDSMIALAYTKEGQEYAPNSLINAFTDGVNAGNAEVMDLYELEDELDCENVEKEATQAVFDMRNSFIQFITYGFNTDGLEKDIAKAKRELQVSKFLGTKENENKKRVGILLAIQRAMKSVDCTLDSIIYVRFEA